MAARLHRPRPRIGDLAGTTQCVGDDGDLQLELRHGRHVLPRAAATTGGQAGQRRFEPIGDASRTSTTSALAKSFFVWTTVIATARRQRTADEDHSAVGEMADGVAAGGHLLGGPRSTTST